MREGLIIDKWKKEEVEVDCALDIKAKDYMVLIGSVISSPSISCFIVLLSCWGWWLTTLRMHGIGMMLAWGLQLTRVRKKQYLVVNEALLRSSFFLPTFLKMRNLCITLHFFSKGKNGQHLVLFKWKISLRWENINSYWIFFISFSKNKNYDSLLFHVALFLMSSIMTIRSKQMVEISLAEEEDYMLDHDWVFINERKLRNVPIKLTSYSHLPFFKLDHSFESIIMSSI